VLQLPVPLYSRNGRCDLFHRFPFLRTL
jgi:hypothetical protein